MRIKLFEPFLNYKSAYLVVNKEPRRHVVLVDQDNKQSCTSFARYLMCIKEKRLLDSTEVVDHIDGNSMHDRYENYQIISRSDNTLKAGIQKNISAVFCSSEFPFKLESIEYGENYVEAFIKSFEEVLEKPNYEDLLKRFKAGETLEILAKETSITVKYLRSKFIKLGYKFEPVRKSYWPPIDTDILKDYQKGNLKLVPGYENYFAAHKEGKIYSLRTGKYLTPALNKAGYHTTIFTRTIMVL